jgi:hypothetical protein
MSKITENGFVKVCFQGETWAETASIIYETKRFTRL